MFNKINPVLIKQLEVMRLNLSLYYLIHIAYNNSENSSEEGEAVLNAFPSLVRNLMRKNILDSDFSITNIGREIYKTLQDINEKNENITKNQSKKRQETGVVSGNLSEDRFEEWWKIYPATNNFVFDGKTFQGTQSKRIKKEECRHLFKSFIELGKFTSEEIIEGTKRHVILAKKESVKTAKNCISFIPNSERYLREQYFEGYIPKNEEDKISDQDYNKDQNSDRFRIIELD